MHNKILMNAGFYLLLVFAFSVTVYPPASYVLAAAIVLIWLLDVLIFKETEIFDLPLFYPLLGFAVFMILTWILASIYNHSFPFIYVALLSLFYVIVPGFVATIEQRRMIIWTFIAGTMLIAGLHLIFWWATYTNITLRLRPLPEPSLFMVTLAFSFLLALYAETSSFREKIFMSLVALPLAAIIILSGDKSAILFLIVAVLLVGILRDVTVFIPFALTIFILFSGVFGINYYIEQELTLENSQVFISSPLTEINENHDSIHASSFYGRSASFETRPAIPGPRQSFLINLLISAGPPALLLFLWILFERAREAYFKRRRVTTHQPRAYHLIALLTIVAIIIMNAYGAVFEFPSIILACWLILGMSEI